MECKTLAVAKFLLLIFTAVANSAYPRYCKHSFVICTLIHTNHGDLNTNNIPSIYARK